MATIVRKSVSIFRDLWERFQTSRKTQWVTVGVIAVALVVWYGTSRVEKHRREEIAAGEQKSDFANSLFRFQFLEKTPQAVVLGVADRALAPNLRSGFADQIEKQLAADFPSQIFAGSVLLPEFYLGGYFEKVFSGDLSCLDETKFFQSAGSLLLIKPAVRFQNSDTVNGMKSCDLTLVCRAYPSSHELPKQAAVHSIGAGFSEESALTKAIQLLGEREKDQFAELLKKEQ